MRRWPKAPRASCYYLASIPAGCPLLFAAGVQQSILLANPQELRRSSQKSSKLPSSTEGQLPAVGEVSPFARLSSGRVEARFIVANTTMLRSRVIRRGLFRPGLPSSASSSAASPVIALATCAMPEHLQKQRVRTGQTRNRRPGSPAQMGRGGPNKVNIWAPHLGPSRGLTSMEFFVSALVTWGRGFDGAASAMR